MPSSTIKCSIIIPCYNMQDYIIRALKSIPVREDIEVILVDDHSADDSVKLITDFIESSKLRIKFLMHEENKGVSHVINNAMNLVEGEYIYQLDSDDYLYTDEFNRAMQCLDGTDVIYVRAKMNDGTLMIPDERNHNYCASWFKFIRKDFMGDFKRPINVYGGDYEQFMEILSRSHSYRHTNFVVYHYNFPREGSITWERFHD